ncbi:putative P22 EaA protein [Escherichia coli]|nr:putative P22 EaA protein [Escherichia coli]
MNSITKERIELFIKNPLENGLTRGEQMELARIALASLEAEPVAYIFKHPAGKLFWALTDESNKDQSDVIPVYAAPPVTVVPEEKPMPNPLSMYAVDAVAAIAEVRGWNACRAAMLQGKGE